jgi:regulatory protein
MAVMARTDIDKLREQVGTFEAPIGSVQLPETGVRYDKRGNPKPLQSGQDEHPEPAPRGERKPRKRPEPELEFTTDLFVQDPAERKLLAACHKALSGSLQTSTQLRRKLVKQGFEPDEVELGLERCTSAGLLDDRAYAASFIESRVRRGHGAARIRQDLGQRGIDRRVVDELLAANVEPEAMDDAALVAARRKLARVDLDEAAARAKGLRWLMSRGYTSAQASGAISALRQERADDTP